jgi:hypothetical protein
LERKYAFFEFVFMKISIFRPKTGSLSGYRRGLLADLADVKDSIMEGCQRAGAKNFEKEV